MEWMWKGDFRAGDPACHCSYSPESPSCLRVPGLTLETRFGLPVCPAGDHRHTSGLITQPPLALAHKPLLPGRSWLSACQRNRARWLLGCCWCRELGLGRQGKGRTEDVSASGSTWGREQSAAGRQAVFGRGPARGVLAVPVACPHSTSHNGPIVSSSQAVWRRFLGHPYPPK